MHTPNPYPRKYPKDPSKGSWVCKIKIGKLHHPVSLAVPWPGNKREATERAKQLQVEVQVGKLGPETGEWLGVRSADKIALMMGCRGSLQGDDASPETWESARQAWLSATREKDTKSRPSGKINVIDRMKKDRSSRSNVFVEWCIANAERFRKRPFTSVLIDFLKARKLAAKSAATIRHDYRVLVKFGEFLADRGLTETPVRSRIKEVLPNEESVENWVPKWDVDRLFLERFHEHRFDSPDALNAWRLILVVRGTACRPTEAIHMAWSSVDLDAGTITFKDRKNRKGKRRRDETIPIVLQWVKDGLAELKSLGGKQGTPVCVSTRDSHWSSEAMSAKCIRRARTRLKVSHRYTLKASQRAAIAQLEDLKFSPYLSAHLAGHSLKTQEEHYTRPDNYWRSDPKRDMGKWDKLTSIGEQVRSRYANDPLPSPTLP